MARRRSRAVLAAVAVAVVVTVLAVVAVRLLDDEPTVASPQDPVASDAPASAATSSSTPEAYPDADNTGVPPGTELAPYVGPCTITETAVLSAVDATGVCPAIVVQAAGVRIEASRVPRVESTATQVDPTYSVEVVDSEVVAGEWIGGAVWGSNLTVRRSDVTGGQHSVHCGSGCLVEDSWLHDQFNPPGEAAHNNAFISNGGTDMVVRHNTLHCTAELNATGGGCTADLSLFGDFEPIRDVLVEDNLFKANDSSISYCAYGGDAPGKPFPEATGVVFTGNVFERGGNGLCGVYGPITSFKADAEGNLWRDNTWDDGTELVP
ncbi:hypothetical protein Pve01_86430 [Planomonospora venezuelensis]|nr:hypothetical protein Pve01_86430 [Planomonospora venezuelensis]